MGLFNRTIEQTQTKALEVCTPAAAVLRPAGGAVARAHRQEHVDLWTEMPAPYRQEAQERVDFVRAVLGAAQVYGLSRERACEVVAGREAARFPVLLKAGKGGASALTWDNFRRWLGLLGADSQGRPDLGNVQALAPRYVRGERGGYEMNAQFLKLLAGFYETQNRLSLREAYRCAVDVARRTGLHPELICTLPQAAYYYKHKVDQGSVMQARMGRDWAENNLAGYITRDWALIEAGEVWFGDHHQFDAPCKYWDETNGAWAPGRPWLTAWMDAKSRYFPGWIIRVCEYPNSLAIEDALLSGIRVNGNRPPLVIYTDNGKDYTSTGFYEPVVTADGTRHAISLELGCRHITALPYNARAKPIERAFKDVAGGFAKYWAGYLGNRPGNRPEAAQERWEDPESLPTLQVFVEAFSWWLENRYHNNAETESAATGGLAPAEVWGKRPALRPAMADATLHLAFLKPLKQLRQVGRGGRLEIGGRAYQSQALWPLVGKKVLVKLDRFNVEHVYAFQLDGRLIGEAANIKAIHPYAAPAEQISELMAQNRRQLTHARQSHQERTGEIKVIPAMDRLALVAPGVTAADVQQQLSDTTPLADSAALPTSPSTPIKGAAGSASTELVAELEQLLAGDSDAFEQPATATEQAAAGHQEDMELLQQLNTEDGHKW